MNMNASIRDRIEPVYTIGVAAKKLDVSVHSLRQYEREGLILSFKTDTGRRLYSDPEIDKVRCIKRMVQEEGLNFEGIRRLLALVPCWKLRQCSKKSQTSCIAGKSHLKPCWATREKCHNPLPSCRDCSVYQGITHCSIIKELLFTAK